MNENTTRVTRVAIESSEAGIDVMVTVMRCLPPYIPGPSPDVNDVPPDVRAALGVWLYPDETAR